MISCLWPPRDALDVFWGEEGGVGDGGFAHRRGRGMMHSAPFVMFVGQAGEGKPFTSFGKRVVRGRQLRRAA